MKYRVWYSTESFADYLIDNTNLKSKIIVKRKFGVWKLWEELKIQYPNKHFSFAHSYGLGVLGIGNMYPNHLLQMFEADDEKIEEFRTYFYRLNAKLIKEYKEKGITLNI